MSDPEYDPSCIGSRWGRIIALGLIPVSGGVALLVWFGSGGRMPVYGGWLVSYFFVVDVLAVVSLVGGICVGFLVPDALYPRVGIALGAYLGLIAMRLLVGMCLLGWALTAAPGGCG